VKMPALPPLSRSEWLMMGLSALLALTVLLQLLLPGPAPETAADGSQVPAIELDTSPLPRPDFPPLASFSELRERPLFEEDRRPPAPPVMQARDLEREFRERWKLTGVIVAGQARFAMLEDIKNRGGSMQVKLGEALDGWTLQELDSGLALFTRDGESLRLSLAK